LYFKVLFNAMKKDSDYLQDISEIRSIMEKSTRFLALSGLSGVMAGIYALAGSAAAYWLIESSKNNALTNNGDLLTWLLFDALVVLILALGTGIYLSWRKAQHQGIRFWDPVTRRMLFYLMIPLLTGGLLVLILMNKGYFYLMAPGTLIFYGLALVNASKFTVREVLFLGLSEISLGLLSAYISGNGLAYWALGFGVLHIVFGSVMYYKYER